MYQGIAYDIESVMQETVLSDLFVSLGSAQAPSGNQTAGGEPDGLYVPVTGLQDIPCMAAPLSSIRISATETKSMEEIMALMPRHVILNAYYPALEAGWRDGWQWMMDGSTWDIIGAEHDSQLQMTRLSVRVATV